MAFDFDDCTLSSKSKAIGIKPKYIIRNIANDEFSHFFNYYFCYLKLFNVSSIIFFIFIIYDKIILKKISKSFIIFY